MVERYFGEELMIVLLAYFYPDLLRGTIGRNAVVVRWRPQWGLSDDP